MTSVLELSRRLRAREVSAVELASAALDAARVSELNAFIDVQPEATLAEARAADARLAAPTQDASALLGVPLAHKDIFVTRNWRSTAASRMLADYRSPFDAHVVERAREAGAVSIGKLNCDEFAMGSGNENSHFGPVLNPWAMDRVPGGSSGGSAAAVAAGIVPVSTGTDTGGSVRQPAAMCGLTGIKPTYGRVSRYGMIAYASSLDQAGVFGGSAEDCAVLLQAIAGFDARDSTSLDAAVPSDWLDCSTQASRLLAGTPSHRPVESRPLQGLRVGLPAQFRGEGIDEDVRRAVHQAIDGLHALGAEIIDVELPRTELAIPAYYVIAPAEASSNLSRFDGVRYGHRAADYTTLREMYMRSRSEGFGAEVRRRILMGTYVLSSGYYDAYYLKAQQLRRLIAQDFDRAFEQVDVIAGPVAPTTAWRIGESVEDPVRDYLADVFTLPASLAGLPGMSVPCGFDRIGLPVGLQLIAPLLREDRLFTVAGAFQRASTWHTQRPATPFRRTAE